MLTVTLRLTVPLCTSSGTSSVAVAWSGTFDELIGGHILDFFKKNISINAEGLAPYPDFFAVGLILILSGNGAHPRPPYHPPSPCFYGLHLQCLSHCRFSHKRGTGLRSQGVGDDQQDLHGDQHPGAAVRGHLRIHQGRHHQLEHQRRSAEESHVMTPCCARTRASR